MSTPRKHLQKAKPRPRGNHIIDPDHVLDRLAKKTDRLGVLAFLIAGTVGVLASLVPADFNDPRAILAGSILMLAALGMALPALRKRRSILMGTSFVLFYAGLILLVIGDKGSNEGLLALVAIPIIANALYGPRAITVFAFACGVTALIFNASINRFGIDDYVQLLAVWIATCAGIAFATHSLRSRLEATVSEREKTIEREAMFSMASDELYAVLDSDLVLQLGLQSATRVTALPSQPQAGAVLFLFEGDKANLIASYLPEYYNTGKQNPRIDQVSFPLHVTKALRDTATDNNDRLFELNPSTIVPEELEPILAELNIQNAVCQIIRVGTSAYGLLAVVNSGSMEFSTDQGQWLHRFCGILELAISRSLIHESETTIDHLTGLANRREFERRLAAMPRGANFSVLALDVDKLKEMNDTFGHEAGDELLKTVAAAIKHSIRRGDLGARIGGDEFVVIAHATQGVDITSIADRILAETRTATVRGQRASVSIGISTPGNSSDGRAQLVQADKALYDAKHAGGDRAVKAPLKAVIHRDSSALTLIDAADISVSMVTKSPTKA